VVSVLGGNLFFANAYEFDTTTTVGQEHVSCIVAAEETIESLWSTPGYITLTFTTADFGTPENRPAAYVNITYAQLTSALSAQEQLGDNLYGEIAAHYLPTTNPAGNADWSIPEAYARMLGLSSATYVTDDTVTLNTGDPWSYGQDVTNVLIHEISEGAMGRIGGLGDQNNIWSTMDLFRYSSSGAPDYSDGRNGNPNPYFSYDGGKTLSNLEFNDRYGPTTGAGGSTYPQNAANGDTADFT
jgi:hypothetical protein